MHTFDILVESRLNIKTNICYFLDYICSWPHVLRFMACNMILTVMYDMNICKT